MFIQEIVNATVQLLVVLLICLAVWLVFGRKKSGFRRYFGLFTPTRRSVWVAFGLFLLFTLMSCALAFLPGMKDGAAAENTVAGVLKAAGPSADTVGALLVIALVKTALTEEILFRGLIARRLIHAMGFWAGNTLHAVIFGAIHLLIFVIPGGPEFTWLVGTAFLLLPGAGGWMMAYANERVGNGSIVPGWIIHGFGNAVAYALLAFMA